MICNNLCLRFGPTGLKSAIFMLWIEFLSNSFEIAFMCICQNPIADKLILVKVMTRCPSATSHYLIQCLPSSVPPCGVTGPQWVKCQPNLSCAHIILFTVYTCETIWSLLTNPHPFQVLPDSELCLTRQYYNTGFHNIWTSWHIESPTRLLFLSFLTYFL